MIAQKTRRTSPGKTKWLLPLSAFVLLVGAGPQAKRSREANFSSPSKNASPVSILLYHRFGPVSKDETTVQTSVFAWQLKFLHDNGYHVVPLQQIVNFAAGRAKLPPRAVAIVADDGHRSVFTDMRPLIERYRFPVTLFIYPSAISNASYAMTWSQLKQLQSTGLFRIESHTYWHPNFRVEKRRRSPADYQKFVRMQLSKSKNVLETKLGIHVDMLAWPFGIYDNGLIAAARQDGYVAAFTIARRHVTPHANLMTIPRYIVTNDEVGRRFQRLLGAPAGGK